ncbi:Transmembrane protein [Ceratobasidium theobromae]|uniref:Transmembrane protein n=1 Tax=Ceratobasidium theobromae TaxID=1582974 RepID=A0A5N5QFD5_9AGAM|nr:Transmembrane protein [Ceratobasidium theobromae]
MDSPPHTPLRPLNADVVKACTCNCSHKDSGSNENASSSQSGHQWRPLTRNPFALPKNKDPVTPIALPRLDKKEDDEEVEKPLLEDPSPPISPAKPIQGFQSTTAKAETEEPQQLLNPGPTWVNLFYDLTWTATFSSLTQNGKFSDVWDIVSYIAFFVAVWWIWASQTLYNINFYTDDWFHLAYIFLQMVIFGTLAATTRGYDVTTYIMHSPGEETLVPEPVGEITPEQHEAVMVTNLSMNVIAASILISRVLFLIQHLRGKLPYSQPFVLPEEGLGNGAKSLMYSPMHGAQFAGEDTRTASLGNSTLFPLVLWFLSRAALWHG